MNIANSDFQAQTRKEKISPAELPIFSQESEIRNFTRKIGRVPAMAFDVDGTLAGADARVSSRAIAALSALSLAGIEPVIITGRNLPIASQPLIDAGHHGIAIACNGALVGDTETGELLHAAPFTDELLVQWIETADEFGLVVIFSCENTLIMEKVIEDSPFSRDGYAVFKVEERPLREVSGDEVYDIMFAHYDTTYLDQLTPELQRRFPGIYRSMDNFFELVANGEGKDRALALVAEQRGWRMQEILGFGDGGNDVAWLSAIGLPIAMENARDEVKAVAKAQIGHHRDDAVAHFIEIYLDELGRS